MGMVREPAWSFLLAELVKDTAPGFKEVFITGLSTVRGGQSPSAHTMDEWPPELRRAYKAQSNIGWNQVLLGRIARHWENITNYQQLREVTGNSSRWISRAIHLCWSFGLDLWQARNQLVHGTIGETSRVEHKRATELITYMYSEILPFIPQRDHSIFPRSKTDLLSLPHHSQLAWLGRVKFMYPDEYKQVEKQYASAIQTHEETTHRYMTQLETNIQ